MEMSYSKDVDKLDEPIIEAAAEQKAGETIRIRVQPSIFRRKLGQHRMWPGVSWTLDCQNVDEAVALRPSRAMGPPRSSPTCARSRHRARRQRARRRRPTQHSA